MPKKKYFQMPEIDQPDPEPGFVHSSDEFIVPPTDEDGSKVRVWCTLPARLHAWMGELVTSRKFPFQYDADLMRYGVFLACRQLSRIEKVATSLADQIEAMRRITNRRMAAAAITDHVGYFVGELEKLRKDQAWGEILYLMAQEKRSAENFARTEAYWGERWVAAIRERCSWLEELATSKMDLILKEKPETFLSLRPSDAVHESDAVPDDDVDSEGEDDREGEQH